MRAAIVAFCILASVPCLSAQQRASELGPILLQNPIVRSAIDTARAIEPQLIDDQIRLCEVEAPPFQEGRRAQMYSQMLRDAGLKNVRIDPEGNVVGDRPGLQPRPNVVLSAHLVTGFPKGTVVK